MDSADHHERQRHGVRDGERQSRPPRGSSAERPAPPRGAGRREIPGDRSPTGCVATPSGQEDAAHFEPVAVTRRQDRRSPNHAATSSSVSAATRPSTVTISSSRWPRRHPLRHVRRDGQVPGLKVRSTPDVERQPDAGAAVLKRDLVAHRPEASRPSSDTRTVSRASSPSTLRVGLPARRDQRHVGRCQREQRQRCHRRRR